MLELYVVAENSCKNLLLRAAVTAIVFL